MQTTRTRVILHAGDYEDCKMWDGPDRWRHGDLAEAHRRQVLTRGQRAENAAILGRSGGVVVISRFWGPMLDKDAKKMYAYLLE